MNRPEGARVLLVGEAAEALASRLAVSGHQPLSESQHEFPDSIPPAAVLLSPGSECRLEELRRRWGAVPMLLGLGGDTLEGRIRCLASGADDFWLSQQGPSDLLMRLRLHLEISQRAQIPIQLTLARRIDDRGTATIPQFGRVVLPDKPVLRWLIEGRV